ncbi:MAG: TauD/TfdA family dioxygenase [Burkholderiaceae bacterium]|nr:TauD/TfdA family dioxygenase [Burkholderiaceae bacterium]
MESVVLEAKPSTAPDPATHPSRRHAPAKARGTFGRWQGRLLSPTLGLELEGIALDDAFSDADIRSLRQLLAEHKVLVFRDQDIAPAHHVAFARHFGELEVHPFIKQHPEHPELVVFTHDADSRGTENIFHSDTSFYPAPSMGSILRCIECPEVGGDTIFVNMVAAYEDLPEPVKQKIAGLAAIHDASVTFGGLRTPTPQARQALREKLPPTEHPVVRTHPETGEKILFINEVFTTHFSNFRQINDGWFNQDAPTQSRDLFNYLLRQVRTPEYQVRVQWQKNTIVFWDNRAVQHYAIADYYPQVRKMMRATVIGDLVR